MYPDVRGCCLKFVQFSMLAELEKVMKNVDKTGKAVILWVVRCIFRFSDTPSLNKEMSKYTADSGAVFYLNWLVPELPNAPGL